MTDIFPTICLSCKRLDRTTVVGTSAVPRVCQAYPDGIPAEILTGADHRQPRGDEALGLIYEPDPGRAVELASYERFAARIAS